MTEERPPEMETDRKKDDQQENSRGTWQRRMFVLEELFCKPLQPVKLADLVQKSRGKPYAAKDPRTFADDVLYLQNTFPVTMHGKDEAMWEGSALNSLLAGRTIGKRLSTKHDLEKRQVARAAFKIMLEKIPGVRSIIWGTGTTPFFTSRIVVENFDRIGADNITFYSNNTLILLDLHRKVSPPGIIFQTPQGQLFAEQGLLSEPEGITYLKEQPVDLVITCFGSITPRGKNGLSFRSDRDDRQEKRMNLQPHHDCKLVLIPIIIENIGNPTGMEVATEDHIEPDINRKYIIITNKPKDQQQQQRVDRLSHAIQASGRDKVMEIRFDQ